MDLIVNLYTEIYLFVAIVAVIHIRTGLIYSKVFYYIYFSIVVIFVGLRVNVGSDWNSYIEILNIARNSPISTVLYTREIGYSVANWIGANQFGGIYFPNLVCALLAVIPLAIFCDSRPNPWLSLVVATPYLIIVVYMGYTRQSAAIGFCLLAILSLERERFWSAIGLVMLGGLFHLTAAGFFLPIIALSSLPINRKNALRAGLMTTVSVVYFVAISRDRLSYLFGAYFSTPDVDGLQSVDALQSAGAVPRLGLGVFAGLIFIWLTRKQPLLSPRNGIWVLSVVGSFALLPSALLTSTFADRMGLYLIPLQLHVVSLADAELKSFVAQQAFRIAVIVLYGAMLTVWFTRSRFAEYWLPYDNLLFHLF